jgi:uncharacterized protein YjiS (DUF1127 family)
MATTAHTAVFASLPLASVKAFFVAAWESIVEAKTLQAEVTYLQSMTDRQLEDMGMKRDEIAARVLAK